MACNHQSAEQGTTVLPTFIEVTAEVSLLSKEQIAP